MKRFIILLTISVLISIGLTFMFWAGPPVSVDPIREQYADVFTRFGLHAEDAYRRFDDAAGLNILANYGSEGLGLLLQYYDVIVELHPYLDIEALIRLCRTDGELLKDFMQTFQPNMVADLYNQFGLTGLRYALDEPERAFLLQNYGQPLVDLAGVKGPIMFDLVHTYSPEFLELYYDDALFNAIQSVGLEGLLAIQTYRGMASTIFSLFGQEPEFVRALQAYGYQQVIPVLYHVYQYQETASLQERITESDQADRPRSIEGQHANVRLALEQINLKGPTFLRQFSIASDGTVTRLPVVAFTNFLEDVLLGDAHYLSHSPHDATGPDCRQLHAVLDILGLLPSESMLTKYVNCAYLRSGLAAAASREAIEGLLALDREEELIDSYGPDVVAFVAQHGKAGLRLVQQTEGAILPFARLYGPEFVVYAFAHGPDLLRIVDEFGQEALDAIRMTQGKIIPYIALYGKESFQVVHHPEGQALIALATVFGKNVLAYTMQYPDDFPRTLFKYGRATLAAMTRYNGEIVALEQQYGDDVLFYAGRYGDPALQQIRLGRAGITLLRTLPDEKLLNTRFLSKSFPFLLLDLLVTSPRTLHVYVGQLGKEYVPIDTPYIQAAFWMLLSLCVLTVLGWIYDIIRRLFWV